MHAYRAALESMLIDLDPKLKHAPIRSIKHTDSLTFERYARSIRYAIIFFEVLILYT